MYERDLVAEIIKSPTAEKALNRVTKGFYDNSYIALWLMEVIGQEWDDMRAFIDGMANERFPWKSTWALPIWERVFGIEPDDSIPTPLRQAALMARQSDHPPINPERIENMLSLITGGSVQVTENVAPNTFYVLFDEGVTPIMNHRKALRALRAIKPSHLSIRSSSVVKDAVSNKIFHGAGIGEFIEEEIRYERE